MSERSLPVSCGWILGGTVRLLAKRPAALLGACLVTLLLGVADLTLPRVGSTDDTTTSVQASNQPATYFPVVGTAKLAGVARSTVFASSTSAPEIFGLTPDGSGAKLQTWRVPHGSTAVIPASPSVQIPGFSPVFAVSSAGAGVATQPAVLVASITDDRLHTELITAGTNPRVIAHSSTSVGLAAYGLRLEAISATQWPHFGYAVVTISESASGRVVLSLFRGKTGGGGLVNQLYVRYQMPPREFRVTFLCFPDARLVGCQVMWVSRRPDPSDRVAIHGLGPTNNFSFWQFQTLTALSVSPALSFQTGLSSSGEEQWYAINPTNGRMATLSFAAVKKKLRISL